MAGTSDMKKIDLEKGEFALIVGEEEGSFTIRIEGADEMADDDQPLPDAAEIVVALAQRLLKDPDFHDEVLEWYDAQPEEEDEPSS